MKLKEKIYVLVTLLIISVVLSACSETDLVAKTAITSFDSLVTAIPQKVVFDKNKQGWAVSGLDDKEKIILSKNFDSNNPDIVLEFNAKPFIEAGLDVTKLPAKNYSYDKTTGNIDIVYELGQDKFGTKAENTVLDTFDEIVKSHRDIIGYHEEGDHYMISLADGNTFSWAKDLSTNKKDLVFALNPKPFVDAGLDTSKIKEWIYTKIPVTDKYGKQEKLDKFVKAFDIK